MKVVFRLSAASLLLTAPLAFGSSGHHMDAANAKAAVPSVEYESALSGYQARQIQDLTDWKKANASVSGGGHAGHGGHMAQPDMDNMHEGHNMGQSMPEPSAKQNDPHAGHMHQEAR